MRTAWIVTLILLLAGTVAGSAAFGSQEIPADAAAVSLGEQTRGLLAGGAPDNPLALRVAHGRVDRLSVADDSLYSVPLRVHVPVEGLSLRAEGDVAVGELRLALAAADREGRVETFEALVELRVDREWLDEGSEYVVQLPLRLAAGNYAIALGVRDERGDATSFVTSSLKVRRQTSVLELTRRHHLPDRDWISALTLY